MADVSYNSKVSEEKQQVLPPKPIALVPNFEVMPEELKALNQWVVWRYVYVPSKTKPWTKPPFQVNGVKASSTNPATWGSFESIRQAYARGQWDGVGFVLAPPYCGIDPDHCVMDGAIAEWATKVVERFDSYTELSPSGTGLRIFLRGALAGTGKKVGNEHGGDEELYDKGRYLTVTGHVIRDAPIADRQELVDLYYDELCLRQESKLKTTMKDQQDVRHEATSTERASPDDHAIIKLAKGAANREKFIDLFDNGDWEKHCKGADKSQSGADQSLCNLLAFYTKDERQIDRLFRQSALCRDKWLDREDYRQRTIDNAIDYVDATFAFPEPPEPSEFLKSLGECRGPTLALVAPSPVAPSPVPEIVSQETTMKGKKKEVNAFHYQNLAVQFCKESGENFVFHAGRRYLYHDNHYRELDAEAFNYRLRAFFLRNKIAPNNTVVGNVAPIINTLCMVSDLRYPALPFYMGEGAFPDPKNIIAFRNGLLDVERYLRGPDVVLHAHTPAWVSTNCLPFDFDPSAQCPQWLHFLGEVFEGDAERIALLQEFIGYCLTGDMSLHKFLCMVGVIRAGKSTVLAVAQELIGEANSTAYKLNFLGERFGVTSLVGKQVAFIGEVNLSGNDKKNAILENLNSIIGGDSVSVERKGQDHFTTKLNTRFMVACNQMPKFFDVSGALASRILILQFNRSFEGVEDRGLKGKLLGEISGIYNWALAGLQRLRINKEFTIPASMKEAKKEFQDEGSKEGAFLRDCCIIERRVNPGNLRDVEMTDETLSVTNSALWEAWTKWSIENEKDLSSSSWVVRNIISIAPKIKKHRTEKVRSLLGIGLKPPKKTDSQIFFDSLRKPTA